jgi:hypothetical protein
MTMIEPAGSAGESLRGQLRLGAVSLARHQLGVLLALGCERIVCLALVIDSELQALQQFAEIGGAKFHFAGEPRGLVAWVTATDEVVALGDGLLVWPDTAFALLEAGPGVIVQPIDGGLAAGFERLDLNHASAAALRVPGRLVERLAELAPDCDGFSALQRIALQAGVAQRMLPAEALAQGHWRLLRSEAEAHAAEAQWITLQTQVAGGTNPSLAAAQFAVRRLGPALLHAGSGHRVVAAAGAITALLALVAGWFHWAALAFGFAGLAWLLFMAAALLGRVERESLQLASPRILQGIAYSWAMDGVFAVLMTQCRPFLIGQDLAERAFAPIMLLAACRLVPRAVPRDWSRWLEDRGLLMLLLAGASVAKLLGPAVEGLAVLVLAAGLFAAKSRATPAKNG